MLCLSAVLPQMEKQGEKYQNNWKYFICSAQILHLSLWDWQIGAEVKALRACWYFPAVRGSGQCPWTAGRTGLRALSLSSNPAKGEALSNEGGKERRKTGK